MTNPTADLTETRSVHELDPKRWLALMVIGIAQLMVILDATIVNIALPEAAIALHITDANRQWVVTAYALPFGALLLLGGRIGDYLGRKKILIVALAGSLSAGLILGLINGFTVGYLRIPPMLATLGSLGAGLASRCCCRTASTWPPTR